MYKKKEWRNFHIQEVDEQIHIRKCVQYIAEFVAKNKENDEELNWLETKKTNTKTLSIFDFQKYLCTRIKWSF